TAKNCVFGNPTEKANGTLAVPRRCGKLYGLVTSIASRVRYVQKAEAARQVRWELWYDAAFTQKNNGLKGGHLLRFMSGLGFAAILLIAMQPVSRAETTITCPKTKGFIGGPFVATDEMARDIFKVMVRQFAPFNLKEYPVVVIKDKGDYWLAYQE